jgi:hypothetical protein
MKNSVVATVEFYFKGEKYSPSMTLDLDALMEMHGTIPPLHATIARQNGIDTYSYLYEVMESEEIHYDHAEGMAAEFITEGVLDVEGLARQWRFNQVVQVIEPIARRCMGIDDLEQQPELKQALVEAYEAGKDR